MAVNFTPYVGLAKPTESEMAQDWANTQKWAEDNNTIVAAKSSFPLRSYAPAIIGPTTNPTVGAGSIVGEYIEFQGWIFGSFALSFTDPGVSAGTGSGGYGITLPTLADITFHTSGTALNDISTAASCVGEGYLYDASSFPLSGSLALDLIKISGVNYVRAMLETYTGKSTRWLGPNWPAALATGDFIAGSFIYKKG